MTEIIAAPLRPAAQYLRMSTDHQRYSLANQAAVIGAYADAEGFDVVRTFEDAGVSGVTTARRNGLKALLRDALAPDRPFDTILVLDVSRWGRFQDPDEAAHYEFLCREAGVEVRYCAEAFANDGSSASTIMKHLKRVMAGEYSRELSERLQTAKRRQTERGWAPGGPAPFGAQRQTVNQDGSLGPILLTGERKARLDQEVRWVPGSPDDVSTLRNIFQRYTIKRQGLTEIATVLNNLGQRYRDGSPWTYARIRAALTNEVALGFCVFNKQPGLFKHPGRRLPEGDWKRVRVFDPLVSLATFKSAKRLLAEPADRRRSAEDMLGDLRRALAERGYLSVKVVNESSNTLCAGAYYDRFGSLTEAYRQIGYTGTTTSVLRNPDGTPVDNGDIIMGLRRLLAWEGYLSAKLVGNHLSVPSAKVIQQRFGSLTAAWAAAGYSADRSEIQKLANRRSGRKSGRSLITSGRGRSRR